MSRLNKNNMFEHQKIIEKKIREAIERGEFKNLPGEGKPLQLDDDSRVPEDCRLAYKILKNANCLPPEIELRKEIQRMEEMLEDLPDVKERYRLIKRINYKVMKLNEMGHSSPGLGKNQKYFNKVLDKLGKK